MFVTAGKMVASAKVNELLEVILSVLESCKPNYYSGIPVLSNITQISLTMESLRKLSPVKQRNWLQIIYIVFFAYFCQMKLDIFSRSRV